MEMQPWSFKVSRWPLRKKKQWRRQSLLNPLRFFDLLWGEYVYIYIIVYSSGWMGHDLMENWLDNKFPALTGTGRQGPFPFSCRCRISGFGFEINQSTSWVWWINKFSQPQIGPFVSFPKNATRIEKTEGLPKRSHRSWKRHSVQPIEVTP